MKRTVPLLITAIVGFVLIASSFVPAAESWGEEAAIWFDILAGIAFVLGGGNLLNSQLKKISSRRAGWGYALVTLVSFLLMLFAGLLKLGVRPAPDQEFYGESFASLPVEALPEFSIDAPVTAALREKLLPASVRRQVRLTESGISLRGWLSSSQLADLSEFSATLEWRCAVEQLGKAAQPPEELRGRVAYLPDHGSLSFRGFLTEADEQSLRGVSTASAFAEAVNQLAVAARRETSVAMPPVPAGFELPTALANAVTLSDGRATIKGPISTSQRNMLASGGLAARRRLSGNTTARDSFVSAFREAGSLNERQLAALERALSEDRSGDLIAAINTAGVSAPEDKTACELLAERAAGASELNPKKPAAPASVLNAEQEQAIREIIGAGRMEWAVLKDRLSAAGSIIPAQTAAIDEFQNGLPTE
jgi:hypothetical protein